MIEQTKLKDSYMKAIIENQKAEVQNIVNGYFETRGIKRKNNEDLEEFTRQCIYYHEITTGVDTKQQMILIDVNKANEVQDKEIFYIPYTTKVKFAEVGNARDINAVYNSNYLEEATAKEIYITDNIFDTLLIENITSEDTENKAITIFNDITSDTNNSLLAFKQLIVDNKNKLYKTCFNVLVKDRELENIVTETLKDNGLKYNIQTIPKQYSCFNEYYKKDYTKAIKTLAENTAIQDDSLTNYFYKFMEEFEENANKEPLKTGFNTLDNTIKGILPRTL